MNAPAAMLSAGPRESVASPSLADVLSLVEVEERRRTLLRPDHSSSAASTDGAPAKRNDPASAIDLMALLGRCLGNIELVQRVLTSFRNSGGTDLARLQLAIEQSEFETVIEVAHRFKGAAGNVSASGLRRIAISMEQFARERNGMALELALTQCRTEWDEFIRCADALAPAASTPAIGPAGKSN